MNNEYSITESIKRIEDELMASMIRNLRNHRAEEIAEGYNWEQWQVKQLEALERYKKRNAKKYGNEFKDINQQIGALLTLARQEGDMTQEIKILNAIKNGFKADRVSPELAASFFLTNDRKLEALINATVSDMGRAETAILRMANDKYRRIIFDAQMYANSGAGTYEKAVDMATLDMRRAGLNCVEYKNGARHTLSDYADMAIRTASKRAYLYGEGEKRQEWGIGTVIMVKRGNPCPKCAPFVGRVLIDDVWSGGKPDGKHKLMSDAIKAGLYHPRCKDSHTTYFDGITEEEPYTEEEQEELEEEYVQEQRENYYRRHAEQCDRLGEYALDADNIARYSSRRDDWNALADGDLIILDFMGKPQIFTNERFKVKAYEVNGMYGIFTQTNSKDAKNTIEFISKMQHNDVIKDVSKTVVVKDLPGIAAYDHVTDVLYVNERLSNKTFIDEQLSSEYFVAENAEEVIKHEMFHKKHWDFVMTKSENHVNIKHEIEAELHKYVAEQQSYDELYISKTVSGNAMNLFKYCDSLNELIAEVMLQEEKGIVKDEILLQLARGCIE